MFGFAVIWRWLSEMSPEVTRRDGSHEHYYLAEVRGVGTASCEAPTLLFGRADMPSPEARKRSVFGHRLC